MKGLFVTGTDTGVGKTRVAVALIHALRAKNLRVAAMKPVSAGSTAGGLNEDVVALLQAANVAAGQKAFFNRAKMNSAARSGRYSEKMERELVPA